MSIQQKVEKLEKKGYFELQQKLLEIAQGEREIAQWNDIVDEQVKILETSLREVEEEAKKEIKEKLMDMRPQQSGNLETYDEYMLKGYDTAILAMDSLIYVKS